MIAFIVDGEELDLMPNFTVPIEWESGLFSDEFVLNGISTLPLALPFTDKNKRLLRYFHLVENSLKNLQVDCQLHLANNLWCTGQLTVAIKGETFDTDFSEITPLALAADKKLSDIFDDNDFYYLIEPFKRWWALNFSVNLGQAFYRVDVYISGVLYRFDSGLVGSAPLEILINQIYDQMTSIGEITDKFNVTRITDPVTFEEIIYIEDIEASVLTQTDNYNIVCEWLLNSVAYGDPINWLNYQKNLIEDAVNGVANIQYPSSPYCFPVIKNPNFYESKNADFTGNNKLINNYELGVKLNSYAVKYRFSLSPQIFLFALLKRLAAKFNSDINGTLLDVATLYNKCFVYNNFAIDLVAIDGYIINVTGGMGDVYNVFNGKITIKNHVPDISLREFLGAIKKLFATGIFYRNNMLTFSTCKSILSSTKVLDLSEYQFRIYDELKGNFENGFILTYENDGADAYLSEKVLPLKYPLAGVVANTNALPKNVPSGVYYLVSDLNAIYVSKGASFVSNQTVVTWAFYSIYLHDFEYLGAEKEINTNQSATVNDWHSDLNRNILVPHIYQTGSSNEFELGINPVANRFLLFWGLQYGQIRSGGSDESPVYAESTDIQVSYPYASMDNLSPHRNVLGNLNLKFHGTAGLYENLHKEWLNYLNNAKAFTIKVKLPTVILLQMFLDTKVQFGPNQFLIKKIAAPLSITSKEVVCTLDLYRI